VPTLYHWDLPQPLRAEGGWLARETAARFADYAGLAAARLADRIPLWITLNEPFVVTAYGYALGFHAPGRRSCWTPCRPPTTSCSGTAWPPPRCGPPGCARS
jgi:beta-glucosidase/6-phospho-beta-glucosidase/beta-galactosidase